jgi:hypothetical protein
MSDPFRLPALSRRRLLALGAVLPAAALTARALPGRALSGRTATDQQRAARPATPSTATDPTYFFC